MSAARTKLIELALSFPEAWEDHPWGESVVKVGKKVFLFAGVAGGKMPGRLTVKLPDSREQALAFKDAEPAGYGLGRSGWVTVPIKAAPRGLLEDWIEESYRAVAPKKLTAILDTRHLPAR